MSSIKEMLKDLEKNSKIDEEWSKLDLTFIMENVFKKSDFFLNKLIIEVEENLIKKQNEDLPNQKIITRYEKTYFSLLLIQENINRQQSYIKQLELQNEQLKQKFEHYKINIK